MQIYTGNVNSMLNHFFLLVLDVIARKHKIPNSKRSVFATKNDNLNICVNSVKIAARNYSEFFRVIICDFWYIYGVISLNESYTQIYYLGCPFYKYMHETFIYN